MLVNIRGKGLWSAPFSALAGSRDHSIAQLEGKSSAQARARPYFGCTCKMQNRMASWIINLPLKFGHITSPFLRPQTKTLLTTSSGEAFAIQRGKQWKNKFEAAWCRMHKARAKRHIMLQIDTCRLQVWLFRLFGRCSWPCFSNPLFFRRATFQCNLSFNSPSLFLSLSLSVCSHRPWLLYANRTSYAKQKCPYRTNCLTCLWLLLDLLWDSETLRRHFRHVREHMAEERSRGPWIAQPGGRSQAKPGGCAIKVEGTVWDAEHQS